MRELFKYFFIMSLMLIMSASMAESSKPSKLEVLRDVAKALGDLGESIAKITDGVKHLVEVSEDGVSYILAKKTKSDLKDLSAQSTLFSAGPNTKVVDSIDDYLAAPSSEEWQRVKLILFNVLTDGNRLLSEWSKERSDFITEESYARLVSSLGARVNILKKLQSIDAPTTDEELLALKQVNVNYLKLMKEFRLATQELNTYIKKTDKVASR